MAALVVQSRFAGLKIEDDDYPPNDSQKSKKSKITTAKKSEPPKKLKNNNNNKPQVSLTLRITLKSFFEQNIIHKIKVHKAKTMLVMTIQMTIK